MNKCECGEVIAGRGIHVHSSCISTDCPCVLQGNHCSEDCTCVKCKNGKPCQAQLLIAGCPSEEDEEDVALDICKQLEGNNFIRSNKSQVYCALAVITSNVDIIPYVQNACIDSFPNCSVFSTSHRRKYRCVLHAFVITGSSNSKKDLIQLRAIAGVLRGNGEDHVRSYKHYGTLEQPDIFVDLIKQYSCFGEEEKICTAGSTYKCTWNPNSALDFVVKHEITDFADLLYIYRNIDSGKFDSPSVPIPSFALKEQATNAAASLQMSCRKKLFQDLIFEGNQLIKRKRRCEARLMIILKFIAMHEQCCLHKVLAYLGRKLFESQEGEVVVAALNGLDDLSGFPVAISQYFSWMKILPLRVGAAILKMYNGVGKGRNVAFVGPQDVQKSALMRAMLLPITEVLSDSSNAVGTINQGEQSRFCFENATAKCHIVWQLDDVTPAMWQTFAGVLGPLDGTLKGRIEKKYDTNVSDTLAPGITTSNFDPGETDPRLLTRFKVFHFNTTRKVLNARFKVVEETKNLVSFLEGHACEADQIVEMKCETACFLFQTILLIADAYKSEDRETLFRLCNKVFSYKLSEKEFEEIALIANEQRWNVEYDKESKVVALGCRSQKYLQEPLRIGLKFALPFISEYGESYLQKLNVAAINRQLVNEEGFLVSDDEE